MDAVSLSLPYPPCANNFYTVARGRKIISTRGREWRELAVATAKLRYQGPTLTARLTVALDVFPPDRRRRDIDGTIKHALDALVRARVIADDSQIDSLHVARRPMDRDGGHVVVTIAEAADA